jgi:hypothetical protein
MLQAYEFQVRDKPGWAVMIGYEITAEDAVRDLRERLGDRLIAVRERGMGRVIFERGPSVGLGLGCYAETG